MKFLLPALMFLVACQTSSEVKPPPAVTEQVNVATERADVARVDPPIKTPEMERLETELTLNLWVYLRKEESRLQKLLTDTKTTDAEKVAVRILLSLVKAQSDETWASIFQD